MEIIQQVHLEVMPDDTLAVINCFFFVFFALVDSGMLSRGHMTGRSKRGICTLKERSCNETAFGIKSSWCTCVCVKTNNVYFLFFFLFLAHI